ncbi:hypothetical protein BH10PSE12_BH10PSE12_16050 [soil metagenome]
MSGAAQPVLSYLSYQDFLADVETVACALEADAWSPDYLVGIGRGGLVPAAYLSHRTGIPMLSVDHSSKEADFADALLTKLAGRSRDGQHILFVDDINDSGSTIAYLRAAMLEQGGIGENVRFAVLVNNSSSKANVEYSSTGIDRTIDKRWFIFPWEALARKEALLEEAVSVPERLA